MNPSEIPPASPPVSPDLPLDGRPDLKTLFEALLRRPAQLVDRLARDGHGATPRFALMAFVSFLLFGLVLGCFAKHEQLWAAPLKVTAGLAFASVICFPSLYIFATLAGARISISQLAACLAGALALAGLLLLGFAPAIWIFAESTDAFGFMGSLAIGSWVIALYFALRFLKAAVFATGGSQKSPLVVWSFVFLLVTLQMTTSLRPILGRSEAFLTHEKRFFLQHWGRWFGRTLSTTTEVTAPPRNMNPTSPTSPTSPGTNPFLEP